MGLACAASDGSWTPCRQLAGASSDRQRPHAQPGFDKAVATLNSLSRWSRTVSSAPSDAPSLLDQGQETRYAEPPCNPSPDVSCLSSTIPACLKRAAQHDICLQHDMSRCGVLCRCKLTMGLLAAQLLTVLASQGGSAKLPAAKVAGAFQMVLSTLQAGDILRLISAAKQKVALPMSAAGTSLQNQGNQVPFCCQLSLLHGSHVSLSMYVACTLQLLPGQPVILCCFGDAHFQ